MKQLFLNVYYIISIKIYKIRSLFLQGKINVLKDKIEVLKK